MLFRPIGDIWGSKYPFIGVGGPIVIFLSVNFDIKLSSPTGIDLIIDPGNCCAFGENGIDIFKFGWNV